MIPLKKPEMQDAKFSRNETYLSYVAWAGKLKQRRRLGFFSGIIHYYPYITTIQPVFGSLFPFLQLAVEQVLRFDKPFRHFKL